MFTFLKLSRKIDIVINQPFDMVCLKTALQIDGIRDNTLVKCQYFIYFQFVFKNATQIGNHST